ncbi:MAG: TrkA C-terminal domain-containing protein, partial [Halobacteria archaeon]|nr:TrkA C-terminal domain-containing protein [Halobacteria archaeon]
SNESIEYELVTLPSEQQPEKEFASVLRAADETMSVIEVREGGELVGTSVGELDLNVVAIRSRDGNVEVIPPHGRVLQAGDSVYIVARPEVLRKTETQS